MCSQLSLVLCLGLLPPSAHGQSCSDIIRAAAARQSTHTISVSALRIPARARQHFEKALLASQRNQPELFEREAAKALEAEPRYPEVYLLRATVQLQEGQPERALETIAIARNIQPVLPWSGVTAAGIFNQLHRYKEALAELDRAGSEDSDSWQAKYERAHAETGLQHLETALHWSELAVAAAPVGCTDARLIRANALQLAGRSSEAIAEFETYLSLDRRGLHREQVLAIIANSRRTNAAPGADRGLLVAMKSGDETLQ